MSMYNKVHPMENKFVFIINILDLSLLKNKLKETINIIIGDLGDINIQI
jgi:hypothetical protein